MKKTVILVLFALSFILIDAQNMREASMFEKLNRKPIETVFDEQGREVDKETGVLRVKLEYEFQVRI